MFYKSFYLSLKNCKPENIIIDDFDGPGYKIEHLFFISSKYSEDNQILSLLHEIVHDFPIFRGKSLGENRDEKIESEIESVAVNIFNNKPLIRNYIRRQLIKAKDFPDNK